MYRKLLFRKLTAKNQALNSPNNTTNATTCLVRRHRRRLCSLGAITGIVAYTGSKPITHACKRSVCTSTREYDRSMGTCVYVLSRAASRAMAWGPGMKPGNESWKTSLMVSKRLCNGGGVAAFFWQRRFFLEEARSLSVAARSSLPALGSTTFPLLSCSRSAASSATRCLKRLSFFFFLT